MPEARVAAHVLVLMGVSGSGKTTVGALLAGRLGWPYAEADAFHSPANIAKMAAGHPLTDEDRWPWLQAIAAWIGERVARGERGVVTCSALRRTYRDLLRGPDVQLVYLRGTREVIAARMASRQGHFFKPALLDSQLATLEEPAPDEGVVAVSIDAPPERIVDEILAATGVTP
jgi:gluconokinase